MVKLTKSDKEQMLLDAIVLSYRVNNAYETIFVGQPLSYYNYDSVFKMIKRLDDEYVEQGGESTLEGSYRKYIKKFSSKTTKPSTMHKNFPVKHSNMSDGGNIKYDLGGL